MGTDLQKRFLREGYLEAGGYSRVYGILKQANLNRGEVFNKDRFHIDFVTTGKANIY